MDGRSAAETKFDVCVCGDLRQHHNHKGTCLICQAGTGARDNCLGFRTQEAS